MKITFLGTGTSHGVPMIDCMLNDYTRCPKGVCKAARSDPKHSRTRCSVVVEFGGHTVLIDVSLDFREQVLRGRITRIDAVLITHSHADHIGGMPDIRSYSQASGKPIDVYGSPESMDRIAGTFSYIFDPATFVGGGIPKINPVAVEGPFTLFGQEIVPVRVTHGGLSGCFGWRMGPLAYIPDMKAIDDAEKSKLKGVSCLVVNCLRETRPHATHMILEESMALARDLRPDRCCFVHMCHDIHYQRDAKLLDPWMEFAYDGMQITIQDEQ